MTNTTIDIEVSCKCGDSLKFRVSLDIHDKRILTIDPCCSCLCEANEDGYDEGCEDGGD